MKMKSFFITMLAFAVAATSCSKDGDAPETGSGTTPEATAAYMSVSVEMPKSGSTYAGPGQKPGSENESKVSSAYAITFDDAMQKLDVVALGNGKELAVDSDVPNNKSGQAFNVSPRATGVLIILNPSQQLEKVISSANTFEDFKTSIVEVDGVDAITKTGKFTMINRGTLTGTDVNSMIESPLTKCNPQVVSEGGMDKTTAMAAASANPAKVSVDRLASKVSMINTLNADFTGELANAGDKCKLLGWQLNATNRSYLPYSPLVAYVDDDGNLVSDYKVFYRMDGNYSATGLVIENEFNWLKNRDNVDDAAEPIVWSVIPDSYAMENTMNAASQLKGHTTKAVLKAQYTPAQTTAAAALSAGDSWLRFFENGTTARIYSIAEATAAIDTTPDLKELLDKTAAAVGVADGKALLANLADYENVGWEAAKFMTTNNAYVQVYRNSECYYDILIKHDNRLTGDKKLGKWGVVRNNWYSLNVTRISDAGLPFIPDPTDPDIVDPGNPEGPDPDDETEAYISVQVVINQWTTWTQNVEL